MWSAHIFYHSIVYLFIHLTESFTEQTSLILMRSNLSIFPLMDCTFGYQPKNCLPSLALDPEDFFLFSSKSLIISCFTFKSIIYFELILIEDLRFRSRFLFCFVLSLWMSPYSSTVKKTIHFLHWIASVLLSKSVGLICGGFLCCSID